MSKPKYQSTFSRLRKKTEKNYQLISNFATNHPIKLLLGLILFIVVFTTSLYLIKPLFTSYSYNLKSAGSLLSPVNETISKKIKYDNKAKAFTFDNSQNLGKEAISANTQKISAVIYKNAAKGIAITDTTNKISMIIKPTFNLQAGKQDNNRIIYPIADESGWVVYTMRGTGTKEDILLNKYSGDNKKYTYKLELGDELEAKVESDGSIGIYGNSVLGGNVSTTTENDAALLKKARQNSKKDTLIFNIPKPVIIETNGEQSQVKASYSLHDKDLTLNVSDLAKASYPISIDPSIYVATAQQFMAGNNETNINFNVDDKLIEKSHTTGARFDTWNTTTNLPTASWGGGTAAAGGYIYTVGGTSYSGQIYSTQGDSTFVVPSDVTSLTVKMWGGGGGSGASGSAAAGGAGGGGGFVQETISVTPGETLKVYVGGGGKGGIRNTAGGGGGGGGYSSIYRGSTLLGLAGGGGGGGGGRATSTHIGGAGGAGGGTSGLAGGNSGGSGTVVTGGGGGTQNSGGAAGTGGRNVGTAGSSLNGGLGANGRNNSGADGGSANGGLETGGDGGAVTTTTYAAGGGGGAGYYGGGGGSASNGTYITRGGSGGGGGSSYTSSGATSTSNTAGSGTTPGNQSDDDRSGAGNGGNANTVGNAGIEGADGLIAISYGTGGTTVNKSVNWAKFNTSTGTIDSANPGNGACSGWCTTADYNLPAPRTNFSLVAYNGFLYAIGGVDANGAQQNTVYIAKLGANGEPQLWHPTDTNKNNWTYWYQDSNISSVRSNMSVVAYNNRIYLIGGKSSDGPVNSVEMADINPTGTLVNWTSSTNLPSNLYGHSAQVYNDRLYVAGGSSSISGNPSSAVYYAKINSDGGLNNWVQTTSFSTGRMSVGGNILAVWGGYLYISGGCSAVNSNGYCTNIQSDTQVASINADGSIDTWNNVGGVNSQRMGAGIVTWRDNIYEVGGCSAQNEASGECSSGMLSDIVYGKINQDGDASTVDQSVASGTSPCSGTSPSGCNLPGTSYIGNMLSAAFITNGYLYVIGGCTNNACSATSSNVAYVAISSTGSMIKPSACPSGSYIGGAWCVDTTNTIPGGIAATSPVVFNNRIYLVGGLNGSANKNTIYRTTIKNDGSISTWASQTMTGVGATSQSYAYAYSRANPSAASTIPGNLYIFGGCANSTGAGCTDYSPDVFKCNILANGAISACSTNGQLQIGTLPGDYSPGLGIMSGTVYANYIYLIGGVSPNQVDITTLRYAKFDNNNNVVSADGNDAWVESPNHMLVGRRRADAFGYNGYIYVVGGYDATAGVLADIEFIKVNVSDGSLGDSSGGFKVSAVTINQRWGLSVPVSNSFAYVIGGCTVGTSPSGCTARTDVIQTFQLYNNDSGAPAGYSTSANAYITEPNRVGASSVILNGYIYTAGGCTSATDCTTTTSNISYAPIDANGNIGTWSNASANLPATRAWGKLETAGGSLYYIGGQSDDSSDRRSEIYYATPNSGDITTWNTASNSLPSGRTNFGSTVWNNRIYVLGGEGTGSSCNAYNVCNSVYVSPQLSGGGDITASWTSTSTTFNTARSGLAAISYANNLYIFGGFDGINYLSDSQYSQINSSTGQINNWSFSTSLPGPLSQADGFAANGYLYLIGGRSSTTNCTPKTLVAPISANTTISSGNNPTGIGAWYETNQKYIGDRYGASALYNDGKAYIVGGACGSTLTYASPTIQQTTLLSQPQVAKYSIMIDTDSDVFPNMWLLNGVDNSIGAKWKLKYRSMTNTTTSCTSPNMTTWGQETVFGDVTLGSPGVYTPKNSAGANTNCARFYYFNVTVDSSEAFGYPDDVTRGPTITDLTLQFTADPSKRLMHGRTFTGGLQQPIDTPIYNQ